LFAAASKSDIVSIAVRLRISTRQVERVLIVDCYGHLVFGEETNFLREQVKALLPTRPQVVLNLRDTLYLDSGGMGTLIELFASAQKAGGRMKLAGLNKHIREVLHIAKLSAVFEIYPDEIAAVESFREHRASGAT
jgi:anti-sigma B factor antagonist